MFDKARPKNHDAMQPLLLSKIARACLWRLHEHDPSATCKTEQAGIIYGNVVTGYYPLK